MSATFAQRLEELRKRRNLTQPEAIELLSAFMKRHRQPGDKRKFNYSQQQYSLWEQGKVKPQSEIITAFAQIFEVSIEYLIGLTDDERSTLKEQGLSEPERTLILRMRSNIAQSLMVYGAFGITPPPDILAIAVRLGLLPPPKQSDDEIGPSGLDESDES